jgi:hypothetical protein
VAHGSLAPDDARNLVDYLRSNLPRVHAAEELKAKGAPRELCVRGSGGIEHNGDLVVVRRMKKKGCSGHAPAPTTCSPLRCAALDPKRWKEAVAAQRLVGSGDLGYSPNRFKAAERIRGPGSRAGLAREQQSRSGSTKTTTKKANLRTVYFGTLLGLAALAHPNSSEEGALLENDFTYRPEVVRLIKISDALGLPERARHSKERGSSENHGSPDNPGGSSRHRRARSRFKTYVAFH